LPKKLPAFSPAGLGARIGDVMLLVPVVLVAVAGLGVVLFGFGIIRRPW